MVRQFFVRASDGQIADLDEPAGIDAKFAVEAADRPKRNHQADVMPYEFNTLPESNLATLSHESRHPRLTQEGKGSGATSRPKIGRCQPRFRLVVHAQPFTQANREMPPGSVFGPSAAAK